MGQVSPKSPTPNSPLGTEHLSPQGGEESPKVMVHSKALKGTYYGLKLVSPITYSLRLRLRSYLLWVKIINTYNVLAPASPALVAGLWNAYSLAILTMERL